MYVYVYVYVDRESGFWSRRLFLMLVTCERGKKKIYVLVFLFTGSSVAVGGFVCFIRARSSLVTTTILLSQFITLFI